MQGALMSARCCDALVFANAEAGEGNTVPSAPFQPGKPQEWRSYAECRQAACVNLLEPAHFCVSGETHSFDTIAANRLNNRIRCEQRQDHLLFLQKNV